MARETNEVEDASVLDAQIVEDYEYIVPQSSQLTNPFPMPSCQGITLEEATIDQIQDYMTQGVLTSQDLVQCYMERYFQLNPYLNSVLQVNPDVFDIASDMDAERANGTVRSPLHGIPFLVKDNYGTKDKLNTCAGSPMLLGSIVPRDAFVVSKLREAGAVLFGHASLSEWADMRSNDYSEGYSPLGGQSRNPYNLTINGGGSSTGSAGSVAANMIMFALGTETDGSIIDPAGRQGVVGLKPTVGLTSRDMVIPESHNQDTTGPHARTVRDATYILQYMYGVDENDDKTAEQIGKVPEDGDYVKFVSDKSALKGAKFGLPWDRIWSQAKEDEIERLYEVLDMLTEAGAELINNTDWKNPAASISVDGWDWAYGDTRGFTNESEFTVVKADFYNDIKKYLAQLNNTNIRSLEDIVEYNYANDGTEGGNPGTLPAFASGQDSFLASLEWKGVYNETYYQALDYIHRTTREEGIDYALNYTDPSTGENFQLDGLIVPTSVSVTYQQAAMAGYPVINIPIGIREDTARPFGLSIMQTAYGEPQLIKYGSAIEDLVKGRETPKFYDYLSKVVPVL
ncbi:hypothetical protein CANARDRAFT_200305 [[Candida] arabinofermentans NRRL YB-2248]|uniref:Amidase domain-containing protein n=1 Tax=[Candida] arabinofermentans NRRL YB-2248 TaxID=983967 RepID=A0A1E4SZ59_9ASCO|nr:hypothetical protein CANARDRAFT_200305 [[Candida] arabinofermentans NRRL YB-2248]